MSTANSRMSSSPAWPLALSMMSFMTMLAYSGLHCSPASSMVRFMAVTNQSLLGAYFSLSCEIRDNKSMRIKLSVAAFKKPISLSTTTVTFCGLVMEFPVIIGRLALVTTPSCRSAR